MAGRGEGSGGDRGRRSGDAHRARCHKRPRRAVRLCVFARFGVVHTDQRTTARVGCVRGRSRCKSRSLTEGDGEREQSASLPLPTYPLPHGARKNQKIYRALPRSARPASVSTASFRNACPPDLTVIALPNTETLNAQESSVFCASTEQLKKVLR